ncbi:MAG: efflux RND transporter permease subunit [Alphaproteobacteria bacterium]|nr:efflux RND transporter permease subunit [Alphaproteobacteria bacterium]
MNLMIVIAGIAALLGIEVRELPNVERPTVTVRVDYPGAAPETMDAEVTRVLEGAAARVPGVRSISSASEEGNARMRLYFDPSVNIDIAASDVREAVAEVQRRLPDQVENLVVVKANDEAEPIIQLSVLSETLNREQLSNLIEDQIATAFLSIPGVADVRLFGERRRTLNVIVDPQKLASHRLSIDDISRAVQSASLDVPAGSVKTAEQNLLVRADATVVEESMIERIVIQNTTRISDVANVFYGPAEATSYVRLNGQPVMGIGIIRQPRSNTIEISNKVDQTIEQLNRRLHDAQIVKTSDESIFIRGAVTEVLITLCFAIAIVVLVIMVFIGSPKATLIPAVTIPVALIGTVAAIWLLGFSINILTLLALVLATGMVVDDAIIVLENVERMRRHGMKRLAAAVLGTRQVFFAVLATTVTLASVFIPIAFLPGQTGQLFTEFGFVLAIAVAISSFVALSLCPMLASRLAGEGDARPPTLKLRRAMEAFGRKVADFYGRTLKSLLARPVRVVSLSLAAAAIVGTLYLSLQKELLPEEDRGTIVIRLQGPDGVNLDYSDRQVVQVEALLEPLVAAGEVENVFSIIGRYDLHRGYVAAPLSPWGERRSQHEIIRELEPALNAIPGARASIRNPNSLNIRTGGADLEFAVTGPDYERISETAERLIAAIETRVPEIIEPIMEYNTTQPELSVIIDRQRAADLGIEIDGIASTLQAMVDGAEVAELNVDDQTVPIMIESRYGAVNDTDDLRNLYVSTREGRVLPLSSLIRLEEKGAATELERESQRRAIEIEASLAPGVALSEAVTKLEDLAAEVLPTGLNLVMLGQAAALEETGRDIAITFAIALVVVLLVLAAQFESFPSAFVVMVTVPFGLAAAVLALWATGTSLNIYSQIGLVMLVGLSAKNGILIVEFANQLRDEGHSVAEAAHRAAVIRLRPVLMTMLSTTLAGLPLILSAGPGAEARQSIGWVIFGGVGIAIVTTLYITPIMYRLIAALGRSRGDFSRRLESELGQIAEQHVIGREPHA